MRHKNFETPLFRIEALLEVKLLKNIVNKLCVRLRSRGTKNYFITCARFCDIFQCNFAPIRP